MDTSVHIRGTHYIMDFAGQFQKLSFTTHIMKALTAISFEIWVARSNPMFYYSRTLFVMGVEHSSRGSGKYKVELTKLKS